MSIGFWEPNDGKQPGMGVEAGVIESLLALSPAGSISLEDLDKVGLASQQALMKLDLDAWNTLEELPVADLDHLVRVFTLVEALPGWDAGAKSPVIAIVKILKSKGQFEPELRKWIKSNSDNRYLPYGSAL